MSKEMSQEIAVLQKQASEALQMLMKIEKKEGAKSEQHKKVKAKYTALAKEIQRQTLAPQGPGDGVIMDVASITLKDKATKGKTLAMKANALAMKRKQ